MPTSLNEETQLARYEERLPEINSGSNEVSIYQFTGTKFDLTKAAMLTAKLKKAFPELKKEFFDVLIERAIDKGFTIERFQDAINYTIDNCVYPRPTAAMILSYDKKIKLLTYSELTWKVTNEGEDINNYFPVKLDENQKKPFWVHVMYKSVFANQIKQDKKE